MESRKYRLLPTSVVASWGPGAIQRRTWSMNLESMKFVRGCVFWYALRSRTLSQSQELHSEVCLLAFSVVCVCLPRGNELNGPSFSTRSNTHAHTHKRSCVADVTSFLFRDTEICAPFAAFRSWTFSHNIVLATGLFFFCFCSSSRWIHWNQGHGLCVALK